MFGLRERSNSRRNQSADDLKSSEGCSLSSSFVLQLVLPRMREIEFFFRYAARAIKQARTTHAPDCIRELSLSSQLRSRLAGKRRSRWPWQRSSLIPRICLIGS